MFRNTFYSRAPRVVALIAAAALALVGLSVAEQTGAQPAHAADASTVVYDSVPATLEPHYASQPFAALQVSEFGEALALTRAGNIDSVSVVFDSYACEQGGWSTDDCATAPGSTYQVPITVKLYEPGSGGAVGAVLASTTVIETIPYRPSKDAANCTSGKWYDAGTATCNSGVAVTLDFPFAPKLAVPTDVILGISFAPTGAAAALNVAVSTTANNIETTVGTAGDVYVNSAVKDAYFCGAVTGAAVATGTFRNAAATWPDGANDCALGVAVSLVAVPVLGEPAPPAPELPTTEVPAPTPSTVGADGQPLVAPTTEDTAANPPAPGDTIDVAFPAGTFIPYEWVFFAFYSIPADAGGVQAGADGSLSASVAVPASVPGGSHTLAATGSVSGVISTAAVTIADPPGLAETGVDAGQVWELGMIAAAAILAGLAAAFAAMARRRSLR